MEKIKKFWEEHKKAIIIGTIVTGVVGVGAVIAYKLHLNKMDAIDAIGDGSELGEVVTDVIVDTINKK